MKTNKLLKNLKLQSQFMVSMVNGRREMQILYNARTDPLYLRLDDRKQQLINQRITEDIVLDLGEDNRIVGIEILDASKHLNLERLFPVTYEKST